MKIGINGRFFTKPYTGIGRYCLNIFPEIARLFPEFEFYIAIPEKLHEEEDRSLRYQNNLHFELIKEATLFHGGFKKSYWEKVQLPHYFRDQKVDLIHLPYPALSHDIGKPQIITVHDTIPWTDRDYSTRNFLSGIYNKQTLKTAINADQILTVSAESKKDILKLNGFKESQVDVVYNASEFQQIPDFDSTEIDQCLERYGLMPGQKFLFYMGGYDKRKNVQRVIKIFNEMIAPAAEIKLVLGGNSVLNNSLFDSIDIRDQQKIIRTDFLSNHDLMILYQQAWAYISLTTREGFNLPLLEALTLGCPALVSDLAVHREIADGTPWFLNLADSDETIAEKILALIGDHPEYNRLKQRTDDFAKLAKKKFSWTSSAQTIGEIYLKFARQ